MRKPSRRRNGRATGTRPSRPTPTPELWGDPAPFDVLLAEKASDEEQPIGWLGDEPHRFGALARRLWEPLRAAEKLESA